jgi:hypothetical protein
MASPGPVKVTMVPQSRHCRPSNRCSVVMTVTVHPVEEFVAAVWDAGAVEHPGSVLAAAR